ncbi:MAG: linoleoyl-CoA desaturase [Acidimicrobiaceae bacterium]|jgi:linoleoyl-CoA desaturase|nr:linoleoyl-CoA desaturase [Acidimicrobiaceae bacterium]
MPAQTLVAAPITVPITGRRLIAEVLPSASELAVGHRRIHRKAALIIGLDVVGYYGLVIAPIGIVGRILCAIVLAHGLLTTATGIMHDANHGAFARRRAVNRLFAYSGDVLGASSWMWKFQHNELHHRHTNVEGVDGDIDQMPFARLTPSQPWKPRHRFQHLYMWPLYGFLTLQWFVASDYRTLFAGGIGTQKFVRRPRAADNARMFGGKLVHLTWALVIPMLFHPFWDVVLVYLACSWAVGFALAVIFQMAHCVDNAEFLSDDLRHRGDDVVRHQLRTTVDVRIRGRAARVYFGFLTGGLEYQVEHHLAPRVPHTLYAGMATRVAAMCDRNGIEYRFHESVPAALASHVRWLRQMGARPVELRLVRGDRPE